MKRISQFWFLLCILGTRQWRLASVCVQLTRSNCSCSLSLLRPGRGAEYFDQPVCLCVCLSVCLCVCLRAYLWNRCTDLHEILCADLVWPWLGPPLAALRYLCTSGFMDDVSVAVMGRRPARVGTQRRRSITCATGAGVDLKVCECLFCCLLLSQ